jgi:hypothetical protein
MNQPNFPGRGTYQIKVKGHLDEEWSYWFEGVTISTGFDQDGTPVTTFTGQLVDQAALHSVLARIRDIHLPLLSVNRIEADLRDDA